MADEVPLLPRTALPHEVLRAALEALDRGDRVVLASVVTRHGSTPSTPGQKLVLLDERTAVGTVGGGAVERVVLTRMQAALADHGAQPAVETFRLGASLGMCCGGSVDILVEPLEPLVHALLVGAGHVGVFTAPLLAAAGFRVTLCDTREAAAHPARLAPLVAPPAPEGATLTAGPVRVLHAEHDDPEVRRGLPSTHLGRTAMVVMTHDHQLDQEVIAWALTAGFGFIGGVGSRAKAARTRARLEARGVAPAEIQRVHMPISAKINARTPAEIGVAVAVELINWRASLTERHASRVAGHPERHGEHRAEPDQAAGEAEEVLA